MIELRGGGVAGRCARCACLPHDDLTAHNTFDEPDVLRPRDEQPDLSSGILRIPAASVTSLSCRVR